MLKHILCNNNRKIPKFSWGKRTIVFDSRIGCVAVLGSLFLLVSVAVWIYFNRLLNTGSPELTYSVFEKHVIERTSNTNSQISVRSIRMYASSTLPFIAVFQSFQSLFGSLFSLVSIAVWIYFNRLQNTAALGLNYFVFETFYLLPFLASVSRPQGFFDFFISLYWIR